MFVCDNLAFSGEIKIGRRHTKHIHDELPALVAGAMRQVVVHQAWQDQRYDAYKGTELSSSDAVDLLVDFHRVHGILPWGAVLCAIEEWHEPSFKDHAAHGATVWRLMNAVTEVLKPKKIRARNFGRGREPEAAVWENPTRTIEMHRILDDLAGVLPFSAPDDPPELDDSSDSDDTVTPEVVDLPDPSSLVNTRTGKLAPPKPGERN